MFREVSMVEVKEVLRQRQQGRFLREIARGVPTFSTASGEQRMQPSANLPTGRSSWMVMVSVPRRIAR
jgi:hypothetical protein